MNEAEAAQRIRTSQKKCAERVGASERGSLNERNKRKRCVPTKRTNERKAIRIINDMNIMQMRMKRRSQPCE